MEKETKKEIKKKEKKLKNQKNEIKKLSEEYLEERQEGIYNYIKSIKKKDIPLYIIIFVISIFILNKYNYNINHFIILLSTIMIIYYINDMKRDSNDKRMKEIQLKLLTIYPKPKYFYIDSGIIELIYSIKEYRVYNEIIYEKLILQLDFFLKIVSILEKFPKDSFQLLENLKRKKKEILNILHSIILSLPPSVNTEVKLDKAIKSLHYILNYHEERLRISSNKLYLKTKPNIKTKYIYKQPDGKDELYNSNYNVF
jgi:hypothetical protein